MQVTRSNYSDALSEIRTQLPKALYISIDLEFTGSSLGGQPDRYLETVSERCEKLCRIAENYAPAQIGLTLCFREESSLETCSFRSYNILVAPKPHFAFEVSALKFVQEQANLDLNEWVDHGVRCSKCLQNSTSSSSSSCGSERIDDDLLSMQRAAPSSTFLCRASELRKLRRQGFDLDAWLRDVDVEREDAARFWKTRSSSDSGHPEVEEEDSEALEALWAELKAAGKPVVVHGPLDLFFLLATFEQARLPREPKELCQLVRSCFQGGIFDTAYLHEVIPQLRLVKSSLQHFLPAVMQQYSRRFGRSLQFVLQAETEHRYGSIREDLEIDAHLAHEGGFDSLMTALLLAHLYELCPEQVSDSINRMFLYKSIEALNFNSGTVDIGVPVFSVGTVRVARFENLDAKDRAEDCIAQARKHHPECGFFFRKIDDQHLLVPECMENKIVILSGFMPGVHWKDFGMWKADERRRNKNSQSHFTGIVKVVHPSPPMGLIASFDAHQTYGTDVLFQNADLKVGQTVSFTVQSDMFLNPVACNLVLLSADRRFVGKIRQYHAGKGFGFISCAELMLGFGKTDAFLFKSEVAGFVVGDLVSFQIRCNQKGQVQAHNLTLADKQNTTTARQTGSVKMFDPNKGFGFIASDSLACDVFFHINTILMTDCWAIQAGDVVEFDVVYPEPAGKPQARNIRMSQLQAPFVVSDACAAMKSAPMPARRSSAQQSRFRPKDEDVDGTTTLTPSSPSSCCGSDDGSCDRRAMSYQ
eukprot:TRINITY_DN29301_c0_g1_i1.p1 TRINITY_DN29301_c0_g1~~TRINITY_DN29301_c0_g1_i1.p1  ORF type:complete len:758 (-),score=137.33 TRINITY_DN29301_c0_g1_i1:475-2748(-)